MSKEEVLIVVSREVLIVRIFDGKGGFDCSKGDMNFFSTARLCSIFFCQKNVLKGETKGLFDGLVGDIIDLLLNPPYYLFLLIQGKNHG